MAFCAGEGAVPGVQLGHAGRKASERRPWHGETPVDDEDVRTRSEAPWPALAPSAVPYAEGWPTPVEMTEADIADVIEAFGQAARRSHEAGCRIIEVYAGHGFLVHQFLSPIANHRADRWGGSAANRRRFAVEVARSIRRHWPDDLPLAFRLSATDWLDGGIEIDHTVETARALKDAGVDMIDCSTGGVGGKERPRRMTIEQGFQVPFARQVREQVEIATMAVGYLWHADAVAEVVDGGSADMVALARQLLVDPNWPLNAMAELGIGGYDSWPVESGWWLAKRARLLDKLDISIR